MLITCSKDKNLKFWKFPDMWLDESKVVPSIVPKYGKTNIGQNASTSAVKGSTASGSAASNTPSSSIVKPLAGGKPSKKKKRKKTQKSGPKDGASG